MESASTSTIFEARLDRQLQIPGWDQRRLSDAKIGVVGDTDRLASLFILSAAALGLNRVVVIAPSLDDRLLDMARKINPGFDLTFLHGWYTHPLLGDIFGGCQVIVDLSRYGLANKLVLEKGRQENLPVVRGYCYDTKNEAGFKIFTYLPGREWQALAEVVSPLNLPHRHDEDAGLAIICAGMALAETKNILMGQQVSPELTDYRREKITPVPTDLPIGVVGAGALGNFIGLGLAYSGFPRITFIDPDAIEITNLNRQIFFYEALGLNKAELLAQRLNAGFGTRARSWVTYLRKATDISPFAIIFDGVDNHETRIVLSEKCAQEKKVLISGGTNIDQGQVVVYDPRRDAETPAALLGLYEIVERRNLETNPRLPESCIHQPDPSVIMTNQIIAGLAVDSLRKLVAGQETPNIFYDARSDRRL
ncbi:MAG: ThiF family adenylyltransferase [Thermodesulfobacteriota bacterium]